MRELCQKAQRAEGDGGQGAAGVIVASGSSELGAKRQWSDTGHVHVPQHLSRRQLLRVVGVVGIAFAQFQAGAFMLLKER
eukprot:16036795-Heterocapsa_arctica.AAC.1